MTTSSGERPGAGAELLRCDKLVIGHRGQALLPAIDLGIRRGSFLAVIGRNGSGKSTWLRTLLGFLRPLSGRVARSSPPPLLAYMAQAMTIDPLLPVRAIDLVRWGRLSGWGFARPEAGDGVRDRERRALDAAGAAPLAETLFRDLSEGQKQRVLLARLYARDPDVALLDEPTSAMDAVAERQALAGLRALTRERGAAVILVTHLLGLAAEYADEILLFDRDGGAIVHGSPATVFAAPAFKQQYGDLELRHAR